MIKYSEIPWVCPHCKNFISISVEIESPSDYYPNLDCEICDKEIDDPKLDEAILREASEYWSE